MNIPLIPLIRLNELTLQEFEKAKDEWNALVTCDPNGSIFDTAEWLYSYWKTRERDFGIPVILALRINDELKGGAAFRIRKRHDRFNFLSKTVLEFLAQEPSDYNNILVAPDCPLDEISKFMCSHLLHHSPRIDGVNLREIRNGSSAFAILKRMGIRVRLSNDSWTRFLPLCKSWKEQSILLGRKLRSNLSRCERNLNRDYPDAEFVVTRHPSDNELGTCIRLHQTRMKSVSKETSFSLLRNVRFQQLFVNSASKNDWIREYLLKVRGEIVAALYGFVFKNRLCIYNHGFLQDFASYSPGTLLFGNSIRTSIEEGLVEYDFLRGASEYKSWWAKSIRTNQRLQMTTRRPVSMMKEAISLSRDMRKKYSLFSQY